MALTKITNAVIADNAITLSKMADNSVGTSELVADAVTAVKIDDDGTGFTLGSIVVDTTTMVVDAPNNKVGIGTASPGAVCTQSTLEIKAAAAFLGLHCDGADPNTSSGIEFGDSSDGNIGQIHYWHGDNSMNFATNTLNALTLKSDQSAIFAGSVGIGTTSPQTELTVKTATNRNISFAGGGDIATGVCIMGTNDANSANIPLEFRGSVNCFTTGSVGIGISNPSKLLHLSTDTDDTNLYLDTHHNTPSAHPNIIFRKSTGTKASLGNVADDNSLGEIEWTAYHTDWEKAAAIHVEIDGTPSSIAKPAAMVFTTRDVTSNNLTERMRITSAGRVGIGTASPSHTVSISELSSGDACLSLSPTTGSNNSYMLISNSGGSARIGLERSLGGGLWTGSSAYSMIIGTLGARQVHIGTSETTAITIDTSQNTTFSGGVAINSGSANKITHNHGSTALEIENQGSKRALYVHSNVDGGQDNPLVEIKADNPAFDQEVLRIHNDGANHSIQVLDDGSEVFSIASGGNATFAGDVTIDGSAQASGETTQLQIKDGDSNPYLIKGTQVSAKAVLAFNVGGGDKMVVNSDGRVGIGVTDTTSDNASGLLQLPPNGKIQWHKTSGQGASRSWAIMNDQANFGDFMIMSSNASDNNLNTYVFSINKEGCVGIGTNNAVSPNTITKFLHIKDSDHVGIVLEETSVNTYEMYVNAGNFRISDGTDIRLNLDSSGNFEFNGTLTVTTSKAGGWHTQLNNTSTGADSNGLKINAGEGSTYGLLVRSEDDSVTALSVTSAGNVTVGNDLSVSGGRLDRTTNATLYIQGISSGDLNLCDGGGVVTVQGELRIKDSTGGYLSSHTNGNLYIGSKDTGGQLWLGSHDASESTGINSVKVIPGTTFYNDVTINGNISLAANKAIYFGDTGEYIYGSGTHMYIASSGQIYLTAEGLNWTHTVGSNALSITKSGNGNAINLTHTGVQNVIHIDNNSESGNASVYVENTGSRGYAYYAYSEQGSNQGDPLVEFNAANAGFDRPTLKVQHSGTSNALEVIGTAGSYVAFLGSPSVGGFSFVTDSGSPYLHTISVGSSEQMQFRTDGAVALKLDTDQVATFAGDIITSNNKRWKTPAGTTYIELDSPGIVARAGGSNTQHAFVVQNSSGASIFRTQHDLASYFYGEVDINSGAWSPLRVSSSSATGGSYLDFRHNTTSRVRLLCDNVADSASEGDLLVYTGGDMNNSALKIENNNNATFGGTIDLGNNKDIEWGGLAEYSRIRGTDDLGGNEDRKGVAIDGNWGSLEIQGRVIDWRDDGAASGDEDLRFGYGAEADGDVFFDNVICYGNFQAASDASLKENIKDMGSATENIKSLRPVTFDWISDKFGNNQSGFIAQEVEEVLPDAVTGKEYDEADGLTGGKAINSMNILAQSVKTIQELEERIAILEGN